MLEYTEENLRPIFDKWRGLLRLRESWDIKLELIDSPDFRKTGDFKIDPNDRKAILMLNARNPRHENPEEVICHELLHLKLYPLDQLTEGLIQDHYTEGTPAYSAIYRQFMEHLEITVEELTKCWLAAFGEDKALSYGRCQEMKSFDELFDGLKPL